LQVFLERSIGRDHLGIPPWVSKEVLDELLNGVENADDLLGNHGLMKELKVRLMERMLSAELTEHLGYEPDTQPTNQHSNRRNGMSRKTLKGNDGALPIDVPRDREGSFEPELIKKGQTRVDGIEDKIIGLYVAGLSTRYIRGPLARGCHVTEAGKPTFISAAITAAPSVLLSTKTFRAAISISMRADGSKP
jgi:transposase-like protein